MSKSFVLTLTGADRVGIVDEIAKLLLDRGGNVEASRMARLGGEFAVLMLVSMPEQGYAGLGGDLEGLVSRGYKVTTTPTERTDAEAHPGWLPYRIEVHGADDEGIIHRVAHDLSRRGISIESMETETTSAPFGGVPLFNMTALVVESPGQPERDWVAGLEAIGHEMNLEVRVEAVERR